MENYELICFDNALALAEAAAQAWVAKLKGIRNRPFLVALSGGRIAKLFFAALMDRASVWQTFLPAIHFFWADERCVPPGDPESNFGMPNLLLFQPCAVAPERIHRIRGESRPEEAAREATTELRNTASTFSGGQPVLDLVLLGMGEDGHVASLFPTLPPTITDSKETYLVVTGPKPPPQRITLSYAAIAAAGEVWVLASGPGKEQALQKSLMLNGQTPLARVLRMRLHTRVFSDIGAGQEPRRTAG